MRLERLRVKPLRGLAVADEFEAELAGIKQLFIDLDGDGKPDVAIPAPSAGATGTPGAEMRSFSPPMGMRVESAINERLPQIAAEPVNKLFQASPMGSAVQAMDSGRSAIEAGGRGDWGQSLKDMGVGTLSLLGAGAGIAGGVGIHAARNYLAKRQSAAQELEGLAARSRIPEIEQSYQPRSGLQPFAAEQLEVIGPWGAKPSATTPEWIGQTRTRRENMLASESNPYSTMRNERGQYIPKSEELALRRAEVGQPLADRQSAERRGGQNMLYPGGAGPGSEHLVNVIRAERAAAQAEVEAAKTGTREQMMRANFLRSIADKERQKAMENQPQTFGRNR